METALGPLWVFLRFGDVPSAWTVAGGGVLVCALAVHELLGMIDAQSSAGADAATSSNTLSSRAEVSPVMRLSASPPLPSLTSLARPTATTAPAEGSGDYRCFSEPGVPRRLSKPKSYVGSPTRFKGEVRRTSQVDTGMVTEGEDDDPMMF